MSDSKLPEWFLKQVKDRGWEPILFALALFCVVAFAGGYVLGWWLTQRKTKREIEKLKLENRKASGDIVKELATLREKWTKERELLDLSMAAMRDAIYGHAAGKKSAADLRGVRDEMCRVYVSQYYDSLTTYIESIAALAGKSDARTRAETELMPALKTMCTFLTMTNMQEMLTKCDASKFQLRREPRDGLFARVRALLPWWALRLRWNLRALRRKTDPHVRAED